MLVNLVLSPEAFDAAHFATPGYLENAVVLLEGLLENGVMLVDPERYLADQLLTAVERLPARVGQRLQVLLAEICKPDKSRSKVIQIHRGYCPWLQGPGVTKDLASLVWKSVRGDALVVEPPGTDIPEMQADTLPLNRYILSPVEKLRRFLAGGLPPLDRLDGTNSHGITFEGLIERAGRYSRWLRFFDKQIGRANNLRRFRSGIERILKVWKDAAHYPQGELRAELYTVYDSHSKPLAECHREIQSQITEPLAKQFALREFALKFKAGAGREFHARFLQTQTTAISFDRGFDFLADNGSVLPGVILGHEGNCYELLQSYRKPPFLI